MENNSTHGAKGKLNSLAYDRHSEEHTIEGLTLPMLGQHNVQNALAAIALLGACSPAPVEETAPAAKTNIAAATARQGTL